MADLSCSSLIFFCSSIVFLVLFFISPTNHQFHIPYPSFSLFPSTNEVSNHHNNLPQVMIPLATSSSSSALKDFGNSSSTSRTKVKANRKSPFERIEEGLARSRTAIWLASRNQNYRPWRNEGFVPRGPVYRNPHAFYQSHKEMVKRFRVWPYVEGNPPLFHKGPMNNIYSIEGQFIDEFESGKSPFLASSPDEATTFFLPVSVVNIIRFVYRPYTNYSRTRLQNIVKDYIDVISAKYRYWNRTNGADHFLISCHDWAPDISAVYPEMYKHFIRVLCNANATEGFKPDRDVSLPEIHVSYGKLGPPRLSRTLEDRSILAFFAGGAHGDVRKLLFHHWEGKDKDIQVYHGYVPKTLNYTDMMSRSKFCLCPSGYEVASPRVVESIFAGCVPVIISDGYVLPFSDVLDWTKFSVHVPVRRIRSLKRILERVPESEYLVKQRRVIEVQRHFEVHRPARPYDMMHMVMHSVWLRRLNLRMPQ